MVETSNGDALRAAVQYAVWQVCNGNIAATTCADQMSDDMIPVEERATKMTPEALASLSELTYQYATSCLAADLESFSTHANRRSITTADVLLAVRKHPVIKRSVQEKVTATMGQAVSKTNNLPAEATTGNRESTTASRGSPSLAPAHQPKAAGRKQRGYSSGSSTSSEEVFEATKPKQPINLTKPAMRHWKDSSASSSSDDELRRRLSKKVKANGNSKSTVTEGVPSRNRFRLPTLEGLNARSQPKEEWDLCSSDEANDTNRTEQATTQSRVETIVANLSLDSLPSDHEDALS